MYAPRTFPGSVASSDGLGFPIWAIGLITSVGATVAGALATRWISKPGSEQQRQVEAQIKAQQEMEIRRMMMEQQTTQQTMSLAVPVLGGLALIMLLR